MPKSGTWPGGVALDSLSNMDSAGSCDSVISMNSGYSEDSMEHLSAEERACLMYLEETIEALEVQEDSGLSNDEPDPVLRAETTGRTRVNDISAFGSAESGRLPNHTLDQTSEPQKDLNTSAYLTTQPKPPATESGAEIHQSATKTDELFVSKDDSGKIRIVSSTSPSAKSSEMDLSLIPPPSAFMDEPGPPPQPEKAKQPPLPAGIYNNAPEATVDLEQLLQGASMKTTSVSSPVTLATGSGPQLTPSTISSGPQLSPLTVSSGPQLSPLTVSSGPQLSPLTVSSGPQLSPLTVSSGPQLSPLTVSSGPQLSPLTISSGPQLSPSSLSSGPQLSPLTISSGPQFSPLEAVDPKSPPAVAPKPKKLPANIILKSHKAAVSDGNSVHSVPTGSDRLLLDPQKVRMEALRKLGLLKSDEADPGPILSPKLSPQTRRSWAAPASPKSPAKSHTPPSTPSYTPLSSPSPASVPPHSPAPAEILLPDIVPAPPAFSDPDGPLPSDNEPVDTPPHTAPSRLKQLTPPKGVKAATLERSGPGLSSFMESQASAEADANSTQTPSQLRNSRPRPASLGSGKEFSSAQGEGSQLGHATGKEPELRRSLPAFQHSADSQKLPRSQGISVLICPRAENGDDRREALRRLGLLRD